MTAPTIVCCAHPFGYGPVVKLLLISRRLRAAGVQTIFIGHGVAHEMAAASDGFDEVVHARPADSEAARHIIHADGLFSMMERDFTSIALDAGKPVHVADSLHWMRSRVPEPFARARSYWGQKFLPRDPHRRAAIIPVGPIVQPRRSSAGHRRRQLVINLGGCETVAGPTAEDFTYGDFVMRGLLRSGLPDSFEGGAVLLAGRRAAAHLRAAFPDSGIDIRTVSHDDALELLGTATRVVTSPGLTTTLECFQFAVPTYFLPPQNYSQWQILDRLRDAGLADGAFAWSQVSDVPAWNSIPGAERTPMVRRIISELGNDRSAAATFADSVAQWAGTEPIGSTRRQRAFFDSLGPNGAERIAAELIRSFGGDANEIETVAGGLDGKARS